ncbi:hypothetical protein BDZ97DRAFT_1853901 [Flammula alnicola]|nr:hypothetical protein BDZ97DRAFT_1853901 [Flammula alnicola]
MLALPAASRSRRAGVLYKALAVSTHAPTNAYTNEILTLSAAALAATPSFLALHSPATATVRMLAWAPTATTSDSVWERSTERGSKGEAVLAYRLPRRRMASLAAPMLLARSLRHPHIRAYRRGDGVLWGRYVVVVALVCSISLSVGRTRPVV